MDEFPLNHGFKYNEEYDEWQKAQFDGMLVLWEKLNELSLWELSFIDDEECIHTLSKGDEDIIIEQIESINKDKRIDEIIGRNKQS